MGAHLVTQVLSFSLGVAPEVAGTLSVDCGPSQPVTLTFPLCLCLGKMLRNLQESRFGDQCQQVLEPPHLESRTVRTLPVPRAFTCISNSSGLGLVHSQAWLCDSYRYYSVSYFLMILGSGAWLFLLPVDSLLSVHRDNHWLVYLRT